LRQGGQAGPYALMISDPALFWNIVAAVGQALGALATAAAVIVSLWIVLSERKPQLRITAGMRLIIAGDGTPACDAIGINIANVGVRRCRCTSIGWRTGHLKWGPVWVRRQYALQTPAYLPGSAILPFDLEPGDEKGLVLDPHAYAEATQSDKRSAFFCRKLPWSDQPQPTRVDVIVSLAAHNGFFQKVEPDLARFLATGRIEGGAARFNSRTNSTPGRGNHGA
jgi:hypothetical protein